VEIVNCMAINYLCEILIQHLSKPQKPTKSDIELSAVGFHQKTNVDKSFGRTVLSNNISRLSNWKAH